MEAETNRNVLETNLLRAVGRYANALGALKKAQDKNSSLKNKLNEIDLTEDKDREGV